MGFFKGAFDKLKKAVAGNESTQPTAQSVPQPVAQPVVEEVWEREDLSNLSIIELAEKADEYLTDFRDALTRESLFKFETAVLCLYDKAKKLPLSQKGMILSTTESLVNIAGSYKKFLTMGVNGKEQISRTASSVSSSLAYIATIASQQF